MIPQKIIESISQYMLRILSLHKEQVVDGNDNDILLSLAENDEEFEDIKELCEEIDLYYEERTRLKESGMNAYKYLEQSALEMYKEDNPNATDDECNKFVGDIRKTLDVVIASNVEAFSLEADENEPNDIEKAEDFIRMTEEHLNNGQDVILHESEINEQNSTKNE